VTSPDTLDPHTHYPVMVHQATVLRLELAIPQGKPPVLQSQTVVGDGFSQRSDLGNFLFGPTGLALGPDDTLYVTDGLDNEITAIAQASTRTTSAGKGRLVTKDGLLAWPLAMVMTAQGHLIVCNGKNGQAVEIDPRAGKQIYAHWLNTDQAQSPPGNGDLFGIAMAPDGKSFYYVEDDINSLRVATP
jgi:sugar lactone lactonase YvrE